MHDIAEEFLRARAPWRVKKHVRIADINDLASLP
jgi:hypothetical protein